MKIRAEFPRTVREIHNVWIPLSDGCRLSARIWLPEDAEESPVPAILEYLPYRKNDGTAHRDATHHPYFAGHGYAAVRVDMRGTGDSDGILLDEYLPQEQDDALEILGWLADQPWCTGKVGMIGISWGGFNGLQVAARRPEQLGAVITICSTDDRYADDVHYMGGCVLAEQMLPWASTMLAYNARPPDPKVVGDRWREMWLRRMEETPPYSRAWLSHQRRDDYWKHGSICEDFSRVSCPVYAVGGWADPYSNAVFRLVESLEGPKMGLIGPWPHLYPEQGIPGPRIGFLQECLRFYDRWLKGEENGVMDGPTLRVWMQDSVPPRPSYKERPGRWVAEPSWPPAAADRTLYAGEGKLSVELPAASRLDFTGRQSTGLHSGRWLAFGRGPEFALDQRTEEGGALTFTSDALESGTEVLGFPEVTLDLSSDRPEALVAVWIDDVAPNGESTLLTRGLLNLTHRDGHEDPEQLVPGERYEVTVRLNGIAHSFSEGHRIRLCVSPTYWPWAWPSPEPVTMSLFCGQHTRLELPVREGRPEDAKLRPFEPAETSPPIDSERGIGIPSATLSQDLRTGRSKLLVEGGSYFKLLSDGLEYEPFERDTFGITEGDPLSASVRCERKIGISRGAWNTRVETRSEMTSDETFFLITDTLEGFEDDKRIFSKTWTHKIPRDGA